MSRPALFALAALLATPALALEEGTYPVTTANGAGELRVTGRLVSLLVTGPGCEAAAEGRVLRGADGAWAGVIETGAEPCVLLGSGSGFAPIGASCAAIAPVGCPLEGSISVADVARPPVQVIRSLLRGRFSALDEPDRRAVQALLAEEGLYAGEVDGAYGPGTEEALIGRLQGMADRGEEVDGNSSRFIRELLAAMAGEGGPLVAAAETPAPEAREAAQAAEGGAPVFVGSWSCGGQTYAFTADRYRVLNEYDGSVIREGRLRPDGVVGRTAYLELVGFGNLTFDGVGTGEMIMHDPSSGETWDCAPR